MMKNFKLFLLSFVFIAGMLTSCTNDDVIVEEPTAELSESITTSLARLSEQFNSQGDVIPSQNPTGNIVFDFCFDFVYPLDLSYNNGTTVTVNSLDDLIDVLINSTNDLYINGISFPFDVETYDDASDAIVVVTINSEADFINLLEDCDFDTVDPCECYEVYDPVCVEITAPDGETFLMTYPNACYAECDGFTEADFAENCEEDYNCPGGLECFTFNFPLTIITDDGQTVTVNSQEELDNALYNAYYFDFQYPFDVTLEDGTVVTVTDVEALEALLVDCFGGFGGECDECLDAEFDPVCVQIEQNGNVFVEIFPNACYAECAGFSPADFVECEDTGDCVECDNLPFDPVCVEVETGGAVQTITFPNACYAECEGYTQEDFVECDNNQSNCSEQEIRAYLTSCNWYVNTSLYDNVNAEYAQFSQDGSVTVYSDGSNEGVTGTYDIASNPAGELFVFFTFDNAPHDAIAMLDWTVLECSTEFIVLGSGDDFVMLERDCE